RPAEQESKRDFLWQAEARDEKVSCLCYGLQRGAWATLHAGCELGAAARNDRHGLEASARPNRGIGPENTLFAAGSGVLQCARRGVSAKPQIALSDAGDVSRTPAEEEASAHRTALDQASGGGVVFPHAQEPKAASDRSRLRRLPHAQKSKGRQAGAAEALVCRLARVGLAHRNPPSLSPAVWHRKQLPPNATGQDSYLHARSAPATAVRCRGPAASQSVGLDSRYTPGRWS